MECQPDLTEVKRAWRELLDKLNESFGDLDLQGVLFLVGVQELGKGPQSFSKDQKQDLMHIGTCRLMSYYGYYELKGADEEGWPDWQVVKKPPAMKLGEQDLLLKQAAIRYFREGGLV
jgi:hypothetical protein